MVYAETGTIYIYIYIVVTTKTIIIVIIIIPTKQYVIIATTIMITPIYSNSPTYSIIVDCEICPAELFATQL